MRKLVLLTFLFSQNLWSAEHGVFMVVKGKVRIENSGKFSVAKVSSKIQVGETVITDKDSRAKIVMTDRNILSISPNTTLTIQQYTNSGNNKNVSLNLIEGKIRADVEQKYNNENTRFEVRTATAVAGVRGTQFITTYDKTTKTTEVITLKGQVVFQSVSSQGQVIAANAVVVEKGEKSQSKEDAAPTVPVKLPEKELKKSESDTVVKKEKKEEAAVVSSTSSSSTSSSSTSSEPASSDAASSDAASSDAASSDATSGDAASREPASSDSAREGRGAEVSAPSSGTSLVDLSSGNTQIIEGAVNRKFEKSRVKIIITQPSN